MKNFVPGNATRWFLVCQFINKFNSTAWIFCSKKTYFTLKFAIWPTFKTNLKNRFLTNFACTEVYTVFKLFSNFIRMGLKIYSSSSHVLCCPKLCALSSTSHALDVFLYVRGHVRRLLLRGKLDRVHDSGSKGHNFLFVDFYFNNWI